jgi:hypothetical protein
LADPNRVSTAGVYVAVVGPPRVSTAGVYVVHGSNERRVSTAGVYVVSPDEVLPSGPAKPTITAVYPNVGWANVYKSPYSHPQGKAHAVTQWRLSDGQVVNGSGDSNIFYGLEPDTAYVVDVRDQDEDGEWSEWSDAVPFDTLFGPRPNKPTISVAVLGDTLVTLLSGSYSHSDPDPFLAGVRWVVDIAAGDFSDPVYNSGVLGVPFDAADVDWNDHTVHDLLASTSYKAIVYHIDNNGVSSLPSDPVSFTTLAVPLVRPAKPVISMGPLESRWEQRDHPGNFGSWYGLSLLSSEYEHPEDEPHDATVWQLEEPQPLATSGYYYFGATKRPPENLLEWQAPLLTPRQTYRFRVAHFGGGTMSEWSDWLTVPIPSVVFSPRITLPKNMSAQAKPTVRVEWEYDASTLAIIDFDDLTYDIAWALFDNQETWAAWTVFATGVPGMAYDWDVSGLEPGTYSIMIRARNSVTDTPAMSWMAGPTFFLDLPVYDPGEDFVPEDWPSLIKPTNNYMEGGPGGWVYNSILQEMVYLESMYFSSSAGSVGNVSGIVRAGGPHFKAWEVPGEPRDGEIWIEFANGSWAPDDTNFVFMGGYYYQFNAGCEIHLGMNLSGSLDSFNIHDFTGTRGLYGTAVISGAWSILPNATLPGNRGTTWHGLGGAIAGPGGILPGTKRTGPVYAQATLALTLHHIAAPGSRQYLGGREAGSFGLSFGGREFPWSDWLYMGRTDPHYIPRTARFRVTTLAIRENGNRDYRLLFSVDGRSVSATVLDCDAPCGLMGVGTSFFEAISNSSVGITGFRFIPLAYGECGPALPPYIDIESKCGVATIKIVDYSGETPPDLLLGSLQVRIVGGAGILDEQNVAKHTWTLEYNGPEQLEARVNYTTDGGVSDWTDWTAFYVDPDFKITSVKIVSPEEGERIKEDSVVMSWETVHEPDDTILYSAWATFNDTRKQLFYRESFTSYTLDLSKYDEGFLYIRLEAEGICDRKATTLILQVGEIKLCWPIEEIRIGPLVTMKDQAIAHIETVDKLNELIRCFNMSMEQIENKFKETDESIESALKEIHGRIDNLS